MPMLGLDLFHGFDAASLMEQCGLSPDPWQRDFLGSRPGRSLLLCSRQAGKSTTVAVLALHEALYLEHSLVLLLSPCLRQSQELFRKVVSLYQDLPHPVPVKRLSALRLELKNHSRIISLPGKEENLRGFSKVKLLIIDEAARVPDELYYSVKPMLAVSRGRLVALSTPWGQRGWFYDCYISGGPGWQRYKITASDCPRIAPQFLAEERQSMPETWYRSEYLCEFTDPVDQLFSYDLIQEALTGEVKALFCHDI